MNLFLEYLRFPLLALGLSGLAIWAGALAWRAFRRKQKDRAIAFIIATFILAIPAGYFAFIGAMVVFLIGPPPSEQGLIVAFEEETGLRLDEPTNMTSYRTAIDFFGDWGGVFKVDVPCGQIDRFRNPSGTRFSPDTVFEVVESDVQPFLDVWQKQRFVVPKGSYVAAYHGQGGFDAQLAVDPHTCVVHYQRFAW